MVIAKIFNNVTIGYESMSFFVHRDIMKWQCTKQTKTNVCVTVAV